MTSSTCTVLIVEDFSPDRELYRRYLLADSICTYHVLEASSAGFGLELCRTQAIDMILLDYVLPDANGLEFLTTLHTQTQGQIPPVVMVTGEGDEKIAVQAMKLGAEDYLVKCSLTPARLQLTVRSAIENARLRLQLQQSEDRFRVSVENMLDCVGIYSAIREGNGQITDFRIDYLNASALEANRMTQVDIGKGLCELLPAHRETGLFAEYCQLVETGKPLIKESLVYSDIFGKQLLTRAFDIHASKLGDGFVVSWRDVTARKQAELVLCEANQKITAIWESMTDAYVTLDRDWRIVYANQAATQVIRQLVALEREEVLGRSHWEIFPSTMGQIVEQEYRRAVTEQVAVHFDLLYEPTEEWFEIHAYPSADGLGVYFRDITDRKRTEAALLASEQRFREIFNTSFQLMGLLSLDGIVLEINQAALDSIGAQQSDIVGQWFWETPWWNHSQQLQSQIRAAIAAAAKVEIIRYEVNFTNATGGTTTTDFSIKPVFDGSGQVMLLIAEGRDISARVRHERELKQAEQRAQAAHAAAEAANRSKDEFIAVVAHELRSPLNSVMGWAKLLQSRTFDAATTGKALETIVRNTHSQVQMIDDLLDISRMIHGSFNLTLTPVSLVNAIEVALQVVRPIATAKQIQLETRIQPVAPLSGDFNRLQQIALNLLTNAIKFTPVKGRVEVVLKATDTQACLQVCDTGKGIDPEFLPQIFERFQQGQKNTGSKDGLGLGLAIVKHLVELHGGTITAASAGVGQGATFTVMLPLLKAEDERHKNDRQPDSSPISDFSSLPLAGIRILVVDDEPDSLEMIGFTLEEFGAVVASAKTATMMLERLPQFQPDILLCDIAMPEMDGYELLHQIRQLDTGQIPAIAITAYASPADRARSLQAGFQDHCNKPVDPEVLVEAIVRLIPSLNPHSIFRGNRELLTGNS